MWHQLSKIAIDGVGLGGYKFNKAAGIEGVRGVEHAQDKHGKDRDVALIIDSKLTRPTLQKMRKHWHMQALADADSGSKLRYDLEFLLRKDIQDYLDQFMPNLDKDVVGALMTHLVVEYQVAYEEVKPNGNA